MHTQLIGYFKAIVRVCKEPCIYCHFTVTLHWPEHLAKCAWCMHKVAAKLDA